METIIKAVANHSRTALVTASTTNSYGALLHRAASIATDLLRNPLMGAVDARPGVSVGARVAILLPPGPDYVAATWAAWLTGSTAVPLCTDHPPECVDPFPTHHRNNTPYHRQLQYVVDDCTPAVVIANPETHDRAAALGGAPLHALPPEGEWAAPASDDGVAQSMVQHRGNRPSTGCLIIYTSGTTGPPKGVLHTHRSIMSQVNTLVNAWEWQSSDRILHALPLHHIHGIVNALYCPLAVGAAVEMLPKFSPTAVWSALMREEQPVSVFMGVPTMYAYLLEACATRMDQSQRSAASAAARRLRLAVSGSAACPMDIMHRWQALTGQVLLERYGMSETGMVLSNPLGGERRPGCVGMPLPGVEITVEPSGGPGELLVKGDSVFAEYWNRPEATMASFDRKGFFKTGDVVQQVGQPPYWQIMGRASVDIIKSKGYKISALDVERAMSTHPAIKDVAVVGLPHPTQGEAVAAFVVDAGEAPALAEVQEYLSSRLPPYSIPSEMVLLPELPRNAMGKVNKKQLKQVEGRDL